MPVSLDEWKTLRRETQGDMALAVVVLGSLKGYRRLPKKASTVEGDLATLRNLIRALTGNYLRPARDESD